MDVLAAQKTIIRLEPGGVTWSSNAVPVPDISTKELIPNSPFSQTTVGYMSWAETVLKEIHVRGREETHGLSSLVISPNLDALLEHEELVRNKSSDGTEGHLSLLGGKAPANEEVPVGLPPPPRKVPSKRESYAPRNSKAAIGTLFPVFFGLSEDSEGDTDEEEQRSLMTVSPNACNSSSVSNPFINPAPSLDGALHVGTPLMDTPSSSSRPGTAATLPRSRKEGRRRKQNAEDVVRAFRMTSSPPPSSVYTSRRNSVARSSISSSHSTSIESIHSSSSSTHSNMTRTQDEVMFYTDTFEAQSSMRISGLGPWHQRPLVSHTAHSSTSDSHSEMSIGATSSFDFERRISISSTIYSSANNLSHPRSLYDIDDTYYSDSSRGFDNESSINDTTSFIEFTTSPFEQDSFPRNISGYDFDELMESETQSRLGDDVFVYNDQTRPPPENTNPLTTTPKSIFPRSTKIKKNLIKQIPPKTSNKRSPQRLSPETCQPLPPTTNLLNSDERADLVRKSRKLARMFGQTPGAEFMAQQDCSRPNVVNISKTQQQWGTSFIGDEPRKPVTRQRFRSEVPSPQEKEINHNAGRRHSLPLSQDDISFISVSTPRQTERKLFLDKFDFESERGQDDTFKYHTMKDLRTVSRASFIDLSEEDDPICSQSLSSMHHNVGISRSPSSITSAQSFYGSISTDDLADEDRKRKRERLAKLHRFLGSQVPVHLVLGFDDPAASLPPTPLPPSNIMDQRLDKGENTRKSWIRRRRSSSAAAFPINWSDKSDRLKENLDEKEKAINVKRAQKMEKMFGVPPPQTLFHTRHNPSPSLPITSLSPPPPPPPPPITTSKPAVARSYSISTDSLVPPIVQTKPVRSSYLQKQRKEDRPGSSESNNPLIPKSTTLPEFNVELGSKEQSLVYSHYQHSLISLNDIIDRDDRGSLADLHEFLNHGDASSFMLQDRTSQMERRTSNASLKTERRRSLPTRASMISLASEFSVSAPKPEATDFYLRRRRAAKLTHFFGVDYRELISDILESIEHGLDHERERGSMRAEEIEDLLRRLYNIKSKKEII